MPRLRADWAGVIVTLESIRREWPESKRSPPSLLSSKRQLMIREWSEILDSWAGRPIRRNSVLDWFSERRFADIHWETRSIVYCKCRIVAENSGAQKEMNNWVSSANSTDATHGIRIFVLLYGELSRWPAAFTTKYTETKIIKLRQK